MTREIASALAPVLKAYAEGKQLQWKRKNDETWRDHVEGDPSFGVYFTDWRIKPEPPTWAICTSCMRASINYRYLRLKCSCSTAENYHHVMDVPEGGKQ